MRGGRAGAPVPGTEASRCRRYRPAMQPAAKSSAVAVGKGGHKRQVNASQTLRYELAASWLPNSFAALRENIAGASYVPATEE